MASASLTRTPSSNGNRQVFTFSMWLKRSALGSTQYFLSQGSDNNNNFAMYFDANDHMGMWDYGSGYNWRYLTSRKFRDPNAWYHVLLRASTTDGTAQDRMKLYINGVQETSFSTNTTASSNLNTHVNQSGNALRIGIYTSGSSYFDGSIAHFHLADGTAYTPSTFGETDATTGIWKPKTSPTVTYGTNGFFLKMDNSANMGLDSSGQTNNLTTSGTIIQTKDTPSNVFACLNRLQRYDDYNLSLLNNRFTNTSAAAHRQVHSSLSALSGKYYAEVKVTTLGGTYPQIGVINPEKVDFTSYLGASDAGYGYLSNGNKQYNNSASSWGNTYTTNDIIGIAMDLDNHKLYFSKNGTFQESGDPTSGSTGTGAAYSLATGVFYGFGGSAYDSGTDPVYDWNFGNGYFGTTAVASAGTNASGNGIFEYDVPAGYTALSTKGLNT